MEIYQKGEKIKIPREVAPFLEEIIAQREKYITEYRYEVATAFGFGAKEIQGGFQFALDFNKRVAFAYDKTPEKRIAETPIDKIRAALTKYIIGDHANMIVVSVLESVMENVAAYHWKLLPKSMELEVLGKKKVEKSVPVEDTGGVQ